MQIDPRGPRFGALITMVMFAAVLITGNVWVLTAQAVIFAAGTFGGLTRSPYGLLYRWLVRPRLGPPAELEDAAPPRFAQAVGLVISVIGIAGYSAGVAPLGMAAASLGLVAAVLNGVFGVCLGCEMYLLIRRTWPALSVLTTRPGDETQMDLTGGLMASPTSIQGGIGHEPF